MKPDIDYTLYLVTDQKLMSTPTIEECVEKAVAGGCTLVQLREKDQSSRCFYETAKKVREVTARLRVPLIINDRADIALAVNADGVHVGQDDLPACAVRQIVGPDRIVGVSAGNRSEALAAAAAGADYLGIGAMYATGTKTDADITAIDELKHIRAAVSLPIVVIGGINKDTLRNFDGIGIDGVAAVSAIISPMDITNAARELKKRFQKGRKL